MERAFDYSKSKAALTLLTTYRTPDALRRIGRTRLQTWLNNRGCHNSAGVAQKAIDAANAQHNTLPTQSLGSVMVTKLGAQITAIDAELVELEKEITDRFLQHSQCPGTARSSTSVGRSLIMISGVTNFLPRPRVRA